MKNFIALILTILLTLNLVSAQNNKSQASNKLISQIKGFRSEFVFDINQVEEKLTELANAIPQEKYNWRPSEGVRSISEVFAHIATTNFMLPQFAGIKPPNGLDRNMEKTITEKGKVISILKQSFEHLRNAISQTKETSLNKSAKYFGQETSIRGIFFNTATHMHEHLGQLIAYARSIGVVPPWTAAEQSKQQSEKK
jgi:uncharacterized damage-inducible protein DinB